jgi:fatty acid desaturase
MDGDERSVADDVARATALAHRYLAAQVDDPLRRRRIRRANWLLLTEYFAAIALTYAVIYAAPWPLLVLIIIPWTIGSSMLLDCIVHYLNHWPPFRGARANAVWHLAGALVFYNAVEIRHFHFQHHRQLEADANAQFDWRGLLIEWGRYIASLWKPFAPEVLDLRRTRPGDFAEIAINRAASIVLLVALVIAAPARTLLVFVPAMFVIAPFCSLLMNITDHSPGDPGHPFHQATWLEPATRGERLASAVNLYTAATHLTHHLFPQVHWVHIRELQRELAPIYERHAAPRSRIINSTLLGNPLRLFLLVRAIVGACRTPSTT